MARKALYKHATQVDTNTYPDDGSSPVGSNEWNADPDAQGMLGFSPANATVTISSGVLTVTDTITVAAAESGTSDVLDKLALTNTSQYDLIYLFADTGDTITLTNTSSPSADGQIKTVSNSNETLSSTSPTILIRKGNYWYGYGGGVVNAVNDIANVNITSVGDNDILAYDNSSSKWINQTASEAGLMVENGNTTGTAATVTGAAQTAITSVGTLTALAVDNVSIDSNKVEATNTNGNLQLDANGTGKVEILGNTNAGALILNCENNSHGQTLKSQPHSASVTNELLLPAGANSTLVSRVSADTLTNKTLTSPVVTTAATLNAQAELRLADSDSSNYVGVKSPATVGSNLVWTLPAADGSNGQALTTNGSGTLAWATAGGSYEWTNETFALQSSDPSNPATDKSVIYMKDIDTNNEGLFIKIKKNGSVQIVQIA